MTPAPPPQPASVRQLLAVNACLMLATAALIFRPYFPRWLDPEHYGLVRQVAPAANPWLAPAPRSPVRRILQQDSTILIVGDSAVASCPWSVDRLSRPGMTTRALRAELERFLTEEDRAYEHIVLWTGTWDLMQGHSVAEYVESAVALATLAQQHAPHVSVLSPMPSATLDTMTEENRDWVLAAMATVRQLEARLPGVTVVDMSAFRAQAEEHGAMEKVFLDNMHISGLGYDILNAEFLHLPVPTTLARST